MKPFVQAIVNFLHREDGPTAVEYAVMMALIIAVSSLAIGNLGANVNGSYNKTSTALVKKGGSRFAASTSKVRFSVNGVSPISPTRCAPTHR